MAEFATKGVANAGLTTGIIGTALGALNSGVLGGGSILGGWNNAATCSENMPVSRYELGLQQKIAEQGSQIELMKADKYTDQKILEVYGYVDGRLRSIESQICAQSVVNAQVTANLGCMQQAISTLQGLTKTVIPIGSICPEPMQRYNSWTAPTTEAAAAG